jgi:hypothetical protein
MKIFRENLNQFIMPQDDILERIKIEHIEKETPRIIIIPDKRLSVDFNIDETNEDEPVFELNQFSDLTNEEFENIYLLDQSFFDEEKFPTKTEKDDKKFDGIKNIQRYLSKLEEKGVQISNDIRDFYMNVSDSLDEVAEEVNGFTPHFSTLEKYADELLFSDSDLQFSEPDHHSTLFKKDHSRILQYRAHYGRGPRRWGANRYQSYSNRYSDSPFHPMNRETYPSRQSRGRYIEEGQKTISIDGVMVPTYINWQEMDAITPIKDQFKCNACYAFSATGALEAHHKIKTGNSVSLAEQEIVDCSRQNKGCIGGLPHLVFDYIRSRGISYTSNYRYDQSRHSPCRIRGSSSKFSGSNIRGYKNLRKGILNLIKELSQGPIATISYASFPFKQYRGGIYRGQGCYGKSKPNHSSVLIGYKLTGDRKYLLFKNGWGRNWGNRGFYKVELGDISNRNKGHCMIAATSYNSIPRV